MEEVKKNKINPANILLQNILNLNEIDSFLDSVSEKKRKEKSNIFIVISDNKKLDEINIKLDNIQKILTEKLFESNDNSNIKEKKKLNWDLIKEVQDSFNEDDPSAEEMIKMIKNK